VTFAYVPYESADYRAMERCLGRRLRILRSDRPPEYTLTSRAKRKILRALGLRSAHLWCVDDWFDNGLLSQVLRLQNTEGFDTVLNEYVFFGDCPVNQRVHGYGRPHSSLASRFTAEFFDLI